MDKNLLKHSFLDSYVRMEYIEIEKTCSAFYPENALIYTTKGLEVLKEAVRLQPLYTRYWVSLGELTTTMAQQEEDVTKRNELSTQAENYFNKALQLAPKHQEILNDLTKLKISLDDYVSAEDYSKKCIEINPAFGDCYFYLALSEIHKKDSASYTSNLKKAEENKSDINSESKLLELANAYGSILDYKNLVIIFERLVYLKSYSAQYHSTLAYFYSELGEYDKARQEALEVLKWSPESKETVEEFLKTLP